MGKAQQRTLRARYTTSLARARASATIALRFSLSSKATTSGGRLNSMHPKITATRFAKPHRICLIGAVRSENRSGQVAAAKKLTAAILARRASKGTARETHAGGATAVHRCRLGARTRPGSGGRAPKLSRTTTQTQKGEAAGA